MRVEKGRRCADGFNEAAEDHRRKVARRPLIAPLTRSFNEAAEDHRRKDDRVREVGMATRALQ